MIRQITGGQAGIQWSEQTVSSQTTRRWDRVGWHPVVRINCELLDNTGVGHGGVAFCGQNKL